MADGVLSIGKLAAHTGVSVEAIRYYERIGLLALPQRDSNGRRESGSNDLRTLSFIRRARDLGFKIDDIRGLLSLDALSKARCGDVLAIASRHLADLRSKLRDLQQLERVLATTIARCEGGDASDCPVLNILDIHRTAGSQENTLP